MNDEIGSMAGTTWNALDTHDEISLAQLKKAVQGKSSFFDWILGWLAREDKVVITPEKRPFRVRLK